MKSHSTCKSSASVASSKKILKIKEDSCHCFPSRTYSESRIAGLGIELLIAAWSHSVFTPLWIKWFPEWWRTFYQQKDFWWPTPADDQLMNGKNEAQEKIKDKLGRVLWIDFRSFSTLCSSKISIWPLTPDSVHTSFHPRNLWWQTREERTKCPQSSGW